MGIMLNKQDENEKLTERINADLRRKVSEASSAEATTDFSETDYLQGTSTAGKYSWIWIVLAILALGSLVFIIIL